MLDGFWIVHSDEDLQTQVQEEENAKKQKQIASILSSLVLVTFNSTCSHQR